MDLGPLHLSDVQILVKNDEQTSMTILQIFPWKSFLISHFKVHRVVVREEYHFLKYWKPFNVITESLHFRVGYFQ